MGAGEENNAAMIQRFKTCISSCSKWSLLDYRGSFRLACPHGIAQAGSSYPRGRLCPAGIKIPRRPAAPQSVNHLQSAFLTPESITGIVELRGSISRLFRRCVCNKPYSVAGDKPPPSSRCTRVRRGKCCLSGNPHATQRLALRALTLC